MEHEITHREALGLIGGEELARLKELSDVPGLLRLLSHAALLIAGGYAVLHLSGVGWALATLAYGIVLVFVFMPLHESIHGTASRSAWLNEAVAGAAGFLIVLPPKSFRFFHLAHHRFTQDPANDPELSTPRPSGAPSYLFYLSGIPYWMAQGRALVANALGRGTGGYVPRPAVGKVVREARLYLAGYVVLATVSVGLRTDVLLWLWVIPVLAGQPFLRAYVLAEHAACPFVADMLANTRTTFSNVVVRYLAWNMPHHTAHHALPSVPFHALPKLTGMLRSRLGSTASGYIDAHRQIRSSWKPMR